MRNLAKRAAEAAQNTSGLLEGTSQNVQDGAILVEGTSQEFGKVSTSVARSLELVREIAAASQEQSHGIEQLHLTASEIEEMMLRGAANAEQSAAASEELTAQAKQMRVFVADLAGLLDGKKKRTEAEEMLRSEAAG